jgi:hypothetical protein
VGFSRTLVLVGLGAAGAVPAQADDVTCPGRVAGVTFELKETAVRLGGSWTPPKQPVTSSQLVVLVTYNNGGSESTKWKEQGKSRTRQTQSLMVSSVHIRCLGGGMCFNKREEGGAGNWLEYQRNVSLALANKVPARACTADSCKSVKASNWIPAVLMGDFNSSCRTTRESLGRAEQSPARGTGQWVPKFGSPDDQVHRPIQEGELANDLAWTRNVCEVLE